MPVGRGSDARLGGSFATRLPLRLGPVGAKPVSILRAGQASIRRMVGWRMLTWLLSRADAIVDHLRAQG